MATKRKTENKGGDEKRMQVAGHLKELRSRLVVCLLALFIAIIVGIGQAPKLVDHLLDLGEAYGYQYVYLAPQEMLMQYMSVALVFGLVVTMPLILFQVWAFAKPGLTKRENRVFLCALIFGSVCFCVGVYFAYRIMLPTMLLFLSTLETGTQVAAAISVQNYVSFLLTIFIIFGGVFELPVLSVVLDAIGILKVAWMKKAQRYVIVVCFVLAAFITPPDVVSQVMVAIPMMGLYELSIILCTIVEKLRRKRAGDEEDGEEEEKPAPEKKKAGPPEGADRPGGEEPPSESADGSDETDEKKEE